MVIWDRHTRKKTKETTNMCNCKMSTFKMVSNLPLRFYENCKVAAFHGAMLVNCFKPYSRFMNTTNVKCLASE
jgi:hypothetical protein